MSHLDKFRGFELNMVICAMAEELELSATSIGRLLGVTRNTVIGRHTRSKLAYKANGFDLKRVFQEDELRAMAKMAKKQGDRRGIVVKPPRPPVKPKAPRALPAGTPPPEKPKFTLDELFKVEEPAVVVPPQPKPVAKVDYLPSGIVVHVAGVDVHLYGEERISILATNPDAPSSLTSKKNEIVFNYTEKAKPEGGKQEQLINLDCPTPPVLFADREFNQCPVIIGHNEDNEAYCCGAPLSNKLTVVSACAYHASYMTTKAYRPGPVRTPKMRAY